MSILDTTTQQARVYSTLYHSGNMLPGTNASYYDIRTGPSGQIYPFRIDVAADGVVDLGLELNSTLTAAGVGVGMSVSIKAAFDLAAAGQNDGSYGPTLFASENGTTDLASGGRWLFLPEVGPNIIQDPAKSMAFAIPELRCGLNAIFVEVYSRSAPDAGSFNLRVTRRY